MNIFQKAFNTVTKSTGISLGGSVASFGWALPGRWGKRQQLQQFNRYVYTIVSAFALDFAKTDYKMMRRLGGKLQDLDSHELIDLLESPNPQQSGFQFRELHAVYMKLAGESFWYTPTGKITGKPKEIHLLRPDLIDIELTNDKIPVVAHYVLNRPTGGQTKIEPHEIIHHKYPNPVNPWRGMGVIEAAMTYLQTEQYASEWTRNSIFNSGRPSGIINLKGKMNDGQFEQLKRKFKDEYTGTLNAGKTLLLKGFDGIDWAKMGMDLEGIDLKQVKDITREDIMFMFRTSNTIMGITDDVNRANSKEMRGVWMENVVKPELDRFVDQINHSITRPHYKDHKVSYVDPNPETIQDRVSEWTAGVDKWLTKNDIIRERNEILGTEIPEKDGGNEIWQPLSLTPMTSDKQVEPESDDEQEELVERIIREITPLLQPKQPQKEVEQKTVVKELTRLQKGEIMRKSLFTEQEQWEQPYQKAVNKVFEAQKKMILERGQKDISSWVFDAKESTALWKQILLPITLEILTDQSKHMFDFVDDEVGGTLEITPAVRRRIEERIERFSQDVDNETLDSITETVSESISEGESVDQLRKRITDIYDTAETIRSERIARTETIYASNEASVEAMRQLPSVTGQEWMSNPGACWICDELNGKIISLKESFQDLGTSLTGPDGQIFTFDYEKVMHPPSHPNCRCTSLPVNFDQMKAYKDAQRLEKLEKMFTDYQDMDKRTKEAKDLLVEIKGEREQLDIDKKELSETLKQLEEIVK